MNRSSDDLIELELIESLDELSTRIIQERQSLIATIDEGDTDAGDGISRSSNKRTSLQRESSIVLGGLRLSDVLTDSTDDAGIGDSNQTPILAGVILYALQKLIDALFAHRKFLPHSKELEIILGMVRADMDAEYGRSILCLINLSTHTVHHHSKHPCTELRYVTLLEIILSYRESWEPSVNVNTQWKRLSCKVDKGIDPEQFRRQAYQVLVSLPWVPTSYGLYTACSYKDSESLASWEEVPNTIRSKLEKIPELLLRSDCIHQILHKVRGRDSFTVTISSAVKESNMDGIDCRGSNNTEQPCSGGIGKTTLAALFASHPTIIEEYTIFWVDLQSSTGGVAGRSTNTSSFSHKHYMSCLEKICQQFDGQPNWPDLMLRIEDSHLRPIRELEHMKLAKRCLSNLLQAIEGHILIVLDDVRDEKDFEWFHFLDNQSTIVIEGTQTSDSGLYISNTTYTLEMEELGIDEAIALFASEASHDRQHVLFHTMEARTIVSQCLRHPLIVRTIGRWFKMKQVTAGFRKGIEELTLELSMLKHSSAAKSDVLKALTEIMNMMLSPTRRSGGEPSKVMKLCIASAAVVFSNTIVPMDAVLALWIDVFVTHPDAIAEVSDGLPDSELFKRIWYIAEAFMHLGIFDLSEGDDGVLMVKLHHQLYVEYGLSLVSDFSRGASLTDVTASWHNSFVKGYNSRRKKIQSMKNAEDRCRNYALKRLVYHMIEARSIPSVLELLRDESWCLERLSTHGWYEGSKLHVDDCELLRKRALDSKSATIVETRKVVLACLKKLASILVEETPQMTDASQLEKAKALHLVGFTQANNGGISEALTQYKHGLATMTAPMHPFNAIITYSQGVLHLARNDHDKGLKKLKICLKILKESNAGEVGQSMLLQSEVMQLKGDALIAACDYLGAEESYEEALDLIRDDCPIETGSALYRRGKLHYLVGELDQALAAITESINFKLNIGESNSLGLYHAYAAAGDMFLEFHEKVEALKHYQRALDIVEEFDDEGNEFDLIFLNGKVSFLKNDEDGYMKCLNESRDLIKRAPRIFMDESASDLRIMAKIFVEGGKTKEAAEILSQALEMMKERIDCLERASIFFDLGKCQLEIDCHKEGISSLQESLKIRSSKLGNCEMVLDTQIAIGIVFKKMNMHNEYLACSKEVMVLTETLYKGNEAKAASALFGVAEAYEILGEYSQAVAMYDDCKELLRRALCNDHPDVANVMQRLGKLHMAHGNHDKSFDCYSVALKICHANFDPDHPQMAETMYSTGVAAAKCGDYDGALILLQDALRIQKQLELTNETCMSLVELGNVHRLNKAPDVSIGCYQRCIDILEMEKGDPTIYAAVYLALGHARLSRSEVVEASECYDNALRRRIELYGRDHTETAMSSRSMGIVKYLAESYAEARIYLSDFVRVMEGETKTSNVDYVLTQVLLGEILNTESRRDDAIQSWTKAKAVLLEHESVNEEVPTLIVLVDRLLTEASKGKRSNSQEQKSLFSMFADMARFEEEVTSEIPVAQQVVDILHGYVFLDSY